MPQGKATTTVHPNRTVAVYPQMQVRRILCVWSSAASYIGDVGAAVVTVWHGCVSGLSLVPFRNI